MGARLIPVIAVVIAATIVVASPSVRAQTASTPAIEAFDAARGRSRCANIRGRTLSGWGDRDARSDNHAGTGS